MYVKREIKFLRLDENAKLPTKAHEDDACFDVYSIHQVHMPAGSFRTLDTGFSIAMPDGYAALVCSRSGMASKEGLFVLNAPGVVDSGYRGPLKIILKNSSSRPYMIEAGDRIAQLLIQEVLPFAAKEVTVKEFDDDTDRGTAGFGATGR
jgi:dUTP pyrophosphatase